MEERLAEIVYLGQEYLLTSRALRSKLLDLPAQRPSLPGAKRGVASVSGCGMYVLRDVPGTFFLVMQDTRGKIVVWLWWVWFRSTIRLRWTAGSRNVATLRPASGNWQRTSGTIWTYLRQRFSQHSLQCITFCAERHYLCRQKINLEFQVLQPEPGG